MLNIFEKKENRKKPILTKESVTGFLEGSYEKDAKFFGTHHYGKSGAKIKPQKLKGELKGVRSIEVSYKKTDVDIIFAKDYRKKFGARIVHKNGLKPFLWAKKLNQTNFFTHDIVVVPERNVKDGYVLLPNGELRKEDRNRARVLKKVDNGGKTEYWVRYRIESKEDWEKLKRRKQIKYGIIPEKQITSFDSKVKRMGNGFKFKTYIANNSQTPKYSSNPYFNNPRKNKIVGSFSNLLDFYKEAGIAPRGEKYLDEEKLYQWFSSVSNNKKKLVRYFLNLHRWVKIFNPFTDDSCDFNKIIGVYKTKFQKIEHKINKGFINKQIDKDPEKVLDALLDSGHSLDYFFNIQLDEERIINYIIEPYTFDGQRDSNKLVDYLDKNNIDIYRVMESKIFFVNPLEQYMIQTGRRLFKGIKNYEDLNILTLDIETTAIEEYRHMDSAALSPETGRVFQVGLGSNKGYKKFLHAEEEDGEQEIIEQTYKEIGKYDPDILLTYNGEWFDIPYLENRLNFLGCVAGTGRGKQTTENYIRNLLSPYYEDYGNIFSYFMYRRVDNSMLKVGDSTESFTQTKMFGKNICDVMFAVKRAAAIDNGIEGYGLKYNIIRANLAAKNRVYMDGNLIGAYERDKRPYYLNNENGEYFLAVKELKYSDSQFDEDLIKKGENGDFYEDVNRLYMFLDDGSGKYDFLKPCTNTFGLKIYNNSEDGNKAVLLTDKHLFTAKQYFDDAFTAFYQRSLPYNEVITYTDNIEILKKIGSTGVYNHLVSKLKTVDVMFQDVKNIYEIADPDMLNWAEMQKVSGSYLVSKYLESDIEEPYLLDKLYSQATFAIAKWLPTKYEKIATMGNANVWKLLLAAWSYLNCIGIPDYEEPREFTGGLLGMVSSGFHQNIVKIDYSSLYPSEALAHCATPDIDITGIYKMLLQVSLDLRLEYKQLKNEASALAKEISKEITEYGVDNLTDEIKAKVKEFKAKLDKAKKELKEYDKKQLPLKILINSFYGMLGAPLVSPFSHIDTAWNITCSGRQHMRHLIHYFGERGFKIIYFHTDGANFVIPDNADDYVYTSNGKNWKNREGETYTGVEAYVAEYNDIFMKGRMAVDIDEYAISCINFSKGNFTYLKEKNGELLVEHVGGTLQKKNQNEYIKDFLEESLKTLLQGKVQKFVSDYYKYIKKIYNQKLIARKIADKNRVTKAKDPYLSHVTDGNGNRMAHMELAIRDNIDIYKGDWLYTINTVEGAKGDLTTINDCMGEFILNSKKQSESVIKVLEKNIDNLDYINNAMLKAEKNNAFKFANERVEVEKRTLFGSEMKTVTLSKRRRIDDISKMDKVKFKYTLKKVTERDGNGKFIKEINGEGKEVNKKVNQHVVKVYYSHRELNASLIEKKDFDTVIPYNSSIYISKFNKTMANLWIVFNPEVRPLIPTPNRKTITGDKYDRNPNQRGWFTDKELELISGHPLKGKEDNQQDLDELLIVTNEEIDFWKYMGLSPNNSVDYEAIDMEEVYYITEDNLIFKGGYDGNVRKAEDRGVEEMKLILKGDELVDWLSDKIILDYDNPPYKFVH